MQTSEAADAAWRRADQEEAYWNEHAAEFQLHYPDQYVAVRDDAVVATAPDLARLVDALQDRGLQPVDVWLRYFSAHPCLLLL